MSNRSCLCCRDVGPKGTNGKHRLEEHFNSGIHTGGKTRMAPKPRLPLHDGWYRTRELLKCQIGAAFAVEMWAQRGTNGKHRLEEHFNSGIHTGGKTRMAPKPKLPLHDGWHRTRELLKCQIGAAFAVEMWAQRGQMANTAWKNTSTVASIRGWQD